MSNPQRSHGLQPTRLLHPWDFPGKSTGVGCHCLLRESEISVAQKNYSVQFSSVQSRPTLSNESTLCMRWPKYWSFSFSIIPSKEHPALISFRMDWLDLLAVQGTLKSLLQHHTSKASILQCSAFFTVQLSHPYMTTGKTIALTRWTFVGKVYTSMCI